MADSEIFLGSFQRNSPKKQTPKKTVAVVKSMKHSPKFFNDCSFGLVPLIFFMLWIVLQLSKSESDKYICKCRQVPPLVSVGALDYMNIYIYL